MKLFNTPELESYDETHGSIHPCIVDHCQFSTLILLVVPTFYLRFG